MTATTGPMARLTVWCKYCGQPYDVPRATILDGTWKLGCPSCTTPPTPPRPAAGPPGCLGDG